MGESVAENNALAMPIVYGLMALTAYSNAPDINDEIKDGLPLALLNPTVDGTITLYEITQELIDGGIPTEIIIGAIAHKFKIDKATAKKVVDDFNNPQNIANYEKYKDELVKNMGKPQVSDTKLQNFVDTLYRDNAKIGSGSTADAVREEILTGNPVGGKYHTQKAQDSIKYLQKWIDINPNASFSDKQAAKHLIRDMQNALNGK
ncbi:hypothetical protein [Aliarcobacter butzleri]|uniref:hypothetical protein n=1 Tax=Aliarcobacter butzleri TaxID=28197 RepID=UPI001EDEBF4A|nr:hypothetical protein [Aliarcobacter butzleri]MCG3680073.1 hypothetical protein [Aliarcobacter butzleri]